MYVSEWPQTPTILFFKLSDEQESRNINSTENSFQTTCNSRRERPQPTKRGIKSKSLCTCPSTFHHNIARQPPQTLATSTIRFTLPTFFHSISKLLQSPAGGDHYSSFFFWRENGLNSSDSIFAMFKIGLVSRTFPRNYLKRKSGFLSLKKEGHFINDITVQKKGEYKARPAFYKINTLILDVR